MAGFWLTKRGLFDRGLLAVSFLLLLATSGRAAFEGYLYLPAIPGGAKETNHLNWIEIFSFSEGNQGHTNGGAIFSRLILIKAVDKASPLLLAACASGRTLETARLQLVRAEPKRWVFYDIQLQGVLVTGLASKGTEDGTSASPQEMLSLSYQYVQWTYTGFTSYGAPAETVAAYWDLLANQGGSTLAPAFRITGIRKGTDVTVTWDALSGKTYQLLSSRSSEGPFALLKEATAITNGPLSTSFSSSYNLQFYWLERLP